MWNQNLSILATGYFLMAREAFRVMKRQGSGGSMVFVASKNAIDPAKGSVAYNAAKAAELHMARSLAEEGGVHNIRVNTVLPGIVIQGSSIWNSEWKAHRARQYGVTPDELTNVYRQRNALKANLLPEDIAEAITFLAGPRARYITGAVLSVDGGVLSAYVR
jgi:NAD(P)-dependent dehydrogenase (short-subunit alcohol dehydrogenase family)